MDCAEMLPHAPGDLANEINLKKIALDAKHTANQELRPEKSMGGTRHGHVPMRSFISRVQGQKLKP
jgi:hypothetical protein